MSSPYLTVPEAAERIRAEHRTIRRAIHGGELEAAMIGGKWLITEEALDVWVQSKRPARSADRRGLPRRKSEPSAAAASGARLKAMN